MTAATELFADRGFVATSITDILAAAEVSRGALYHHFASKEEVFAEVYKRVSTDAVRRAGRAGRTARSAGEPLQALISGCLAWIDITAEHQVAQILFVEGPKAIGWDACRDLEEQASLGQVKAGLAAAAEAGVIGSADLDLTARLINAALAEAALSIHQKRPRATRPAARRTITALISGLAPKG